VRITIDGVEYRLFFRYRWEQPGGVSRPNGKVELRHATWMEVPDELVGYGPGKGSVWRTTEAVFAKVIGVPEGETRPVYEQVASAVTRCSPLDKFSKEHGRNESLHRLLEVLRTKGFTGPQLGEIYSAYRATRPIKPKNLRQVANGLMRAIADTKADVAAAIARRDLGI
jgi:hypothetical protein